MSEVRLADLYEPKPFNRTVDEAAIELNAFLRSGILAPYDQLSTMAATGGFIGEMPFFKPLDVSAEPDYTSDDPAATSTPDKITTDTQKYRLAKLHKSWSTMDFARELGLNNMDPLGAITSKVGKFWATMEERRLIAASIGVLNDNVDSDSGDMVVDIYDDIATPLEGNIISATSVLDTRQTAGDHQMMFTAIAMHSVTFNTLNKQNLIDYIPNARGEIDFPSYLGMTIVVDDSLAPTAGTNSPAYISIMFSPGAFGYGVGRMEVPSEMDRVAAAGNGGGQDIIHTRRNPLIHPAGFQFTSTTVASGTTATLAELELSANWTRVIDRKLTGIAYLKHNN